jgi:Domain of unknown function (DUF4386)
MKSRRQAARLAGALYLAMGVSGGFARLLGVLAIIAGCTHVVDCLAYYFFPDYARIVASASMLPQAAGEGGFVGWLLIKGAREDPA